MIVLFHELLSLHPSANVWISLAIGKYFQLTVLMPSCISWSWYISSNAPVSFLYWLWHHLLLHGQGKESAWEPWKSYREVTDAFLYLADNPYYHWDTENTNFKVLERFQHGSLWQGKQWNIRKWSKNPGEYTTHTGKCNNPIFLVDSTRKITDMKIWAPSQWHFTFCISLLWFHLYFTSGQYQ